LKILLLKPRLAIAAVNEGAIAPEMGEEVIAYDLKVELVRNVIEVLACRTSLKGDKENEKDNNDAVGYGPRPSTYIKRFQPGSHAGLWLQCREDQRLSHRRGTPDWRRCL
jgi:hypothetical protein